MPKKSRGFTLIELLVVIAIIGILATIVIFNVSSAKDKAEKAKVINNASVASKGASACVVSGGTLNPATPGGQICQGDPTGGSWPTAPSNFDMVITLVPSGANIAITAPDKSTASCGPNGCTSFTAPPSNDGGDGGGNAAPTFASGTITVSGSYPNYNISWPQATGASKYYVDAWAQDETCGPQVTVMQNREFGSYPAGGVSSGYAGCGMPKDGSFHMIVHVKACDSSSTPQCTSISN